MDVGVVRPQSEVSNVWEQEKVFAEMVRLKEKMFSVMTMSLVDCLVEFDW